MSGCGHARARSNKFVSRSCSVTRAPTTPERWYDAFGDAVPVCFRDCGRLRFGDRVCAGTVFPRQSYNQHLRPDQTKVSGFPSLRRQSCAHSSDRDGPRGPPGLRITQAGLPSLRGRDVSEFFVAESPLSIGIVLDSSNSMRNKIAPAREAISTFLRMSLPEDEFFLISVQDQPELVHAFTRNAEVIGHEITSIKARGWTALYDGMYLGINYLKRASRDRRVLPVLSDGGDNNSRYTESELKKDTTHCVPPSSSRRTAQRKESQYENGALHFEADGVVRSVRVGRGFSAHGGRLYRLFILAS